MRRISTAPRQHSSDACVSGPAPLPSPLAIHPGYASSLALAAAASGSGVTAGGCWMLSTPASRAASISAKVSLSLTTCGMVVYWWGKKRQRGYPPAKQAKLAPMALNCKTDDR